MNQPVKKAVIPVAGLGTRFLPVTKSVPKEMLPVLDKPIIQYAVEEALSAGIGEIILINHPDKKSTTSYFIHDKSLEDALKSQNKLHFLDSVNALIDAGLQINTVFQERPMGLGHAVLLAKDAVGEESFAVILPDDLITMGTQSCLQEMVALYERFNCAVIAVEEVPQSDTASYGIVEVRDLEAGVKQITSIVEKPSPEDAPTNLAVVGRYLLPGKIFKILGNTKPGAGGEVQLTDAIAALLEQDRVLACEFSGKRYDCGSKPGYLKANVEFGLNHPELGPVFREYLEGLLKGE